ncbi:PepSY domain-containing protein [Eleftheria terrae]|uniref:PepSY domain-containing protein n=1 Tax=Eleftheria terrae TaxID=1597781 RepID=UPI00263BB09E|nr:PepSY domain-containing protein [Eleftheria terrae]WKB53588.1 PepSY domain-containing protein [Eleftheria terrae]
MGHFPGPLARRLWPPCRRALYATHRWLGIAGCLLFVMWFASGLVMMYIGFPSLDDEERLRGLRPLHLHEARLGPAAALAALPAGARAAAPRRMGLEMLAAGPQAGPVWRVVDAHGGRHAVSARDGAALAPLGAREAATIASAFAGGAPVRAVETLERDQWTVSGSLDALRPLHRVEVADAAGTELYVSSVSGEVVRDTTRRERAWNWLGAVPHWLYFTPLRADAPLWRQVVLWVSGAGIVAAASGLVIGVLRMRLRRRYRAGHITPYGGWLAWHHLAGLLGGVLLLGWIASGWLSIDPNRWFERSALGAEALARYHAAGRTDALRWPPAAPPDARELQLLWIAGRPLLQWRDGLGRSQVVDAVRAAPAPALTAAELRQAVQRLVPGAPVARIDWLTREDAHWYGHHRPRRLPVWRVVLADARRTWLHIDPASGQVLGSSDDRGRLRRWLFNGAHSLDFPWLIQRRPAWDLVMWAACAAGLVVSASGVVIGWRRLRASRRRQCRRGCRGPAGPEPPGAGGAAGPPPVEPGRGVPRHQATAPPATIAPAPRGT